MLGHKRVNNGSEPRVDNLIGRSASLTPPTRNCEKGFMHSISRAMGYVARQYQGSSNLLSYVDIILVQDGVVGDNSLLEYDYENDGRNKRSSRFA